MRSWMFFCLATVVGCATQVAPRSSELDATNVRVPDAGSLGSREPDTVQLRDSGIALEADTGCAELAERIVFGQEGDEAATEWFTLVPPGSLARVSSADLRATPRCEQSLPRCGTGPADPGQVAQAFAHADVRDALRSGSTTFGYDARMVDGRVWRIVDADSDIVIGRDCSGRTECRPVPAGLRALTETLEALTAHGRNGPCSSP